MQRINEAKDAGIVGFIGLGHMGMPMTHRLLKAQFEVYVYDVVNEAVEKMVKQGAKAAHSPAELTQFSNTIMTSVQTSEQVMELCLSDDGIFTHALPGTIFIDCSSIDITVTKMLHEEAKKRGIIMLDAPVSGGVAGAEAGSLTIMVGGSEINFEKAKPILEKIGKTILYAGEGGSGQAAKICNNLLLGISMIGVCEAFNLAEKLGLDQKKFFEISSHASGQCWSMTSYCPVPGIIEKSPANNHYKPGFMAKMMLKDLRLAHHAAEAVNAAIPLGSASMELYELFINQGYGEIDFSGILNFIASKEK